MQSNVSVTIYNGGQQWLHPVQLGTSTLMAISRRRSTIEEILSVLETIDSDNYIDFMKNYYREGLERFGDNWQYTDQLTILNAAASVLRPTNYLEIGVFRGRSMAVVTHNAPECNVFGFDLWLENYSNLQNTGPDFVKSQLQKVGHRGQVTLQSGNSFDTLPLFFKENPDLYFDLVTVDGDHSEEGARIDLENVLPRIRVGGVLVFDDIRHPKHPWLERVWEEVVESNTNFLSAKYTEVGHGVAFAIRRDTDTKIDAVKGAANLRTQQLSSLLEEFRAANSELLEQRTIIEADRELRLAVIQHQGAELGRIPSLEADVAFLKEQLSAAEADRAARLAVIERQGAELGQVQHQIAQALQLLQQATALPRFGVTLPHEVKQMRDLLNTTLSLLSRKRHQGEEPTIATASGSVGTNNGTASKHTPLDQESAFAQLREPKTLAPFAYSPEIVAEIIGGLRERGFTVEDLTLNPEEYRAYFAAAEYAQRYPNYYDFNLPEKSLEHFVAAKLLELNPSDVYIDIASEHSPVPEIYTRLFGAKSYRQDLAYPEGLNGDEIGGDAAAMAVPDGFASKMALHCSFEHFEGDADVRFVREVERVLRSGGRVCFAPIYLFREYGILTDPVVAVSQNVAFESDATIYAKPGWLNRHGRFYDPAHLASRVQQQLGTMQITIYRITNATDVDPSCYIQFAAVITKP